ncbi:MAG: alpha/beta fold hydrolase [Mycobacteriales bacterium]
MAVMAVPDEHELPGADIVVAEVRLHVVAHGRGSPVLLLHGAPTSSYLWHAVARDLAVRHRSVMPDLVGLGRSERPRSWAGYRLDAQARRLVGLLDVLELDRVAVAGHDLGGAVAVQLAALVPDRVSALVLVDARVHADSWPVGAARPWVVPGVGAVVGNLLRRRPDLARAVLRRTLGAELAPHEMERYLAPLLDPDGVRGLIRFLRSVDLRTAQAALSLLAIGPAPPALVLWGERDSGPGRSYARRLTAALPGATCVPIAHAGHLLPQERPERVAEEIAGFVADALAPAL